jgi:hypothetical protein
VSLRFCVFSYNRGRFLQNCVRSIELCAPAQPITVYDDGSDDVQTQQVLAAISERHRVVLPSHVAGSGKHGGLYANMQRALDEQPPSATVCFIQDDMQLVRRLDAAELADIQAHFAAARPAGLLHPAFLKGSNRVADRRDIRYDIAARGYYCDRHGRSAGTHYSDILLASADQLREIGWRFCPRESANEQQARTALPQMLHLLHPFVAWLPAVPAWRGRTQTLGLRLAQRLNQCGFHPLDILTELQRAALLQRNPAVLPVAEDFLTTAGGAVPEPWHYHPLQGQRLLKVLDSVERRIRKILP